jgi:hypothetical protein
MAIVHGGIFLWCSASTILCHDAELKAFATSTVIRAQKSFGPQDPLFATFTAARSSSVVKGFTAPISSLGHSTIGLMGKSFATASLRCIYRHICSRPVEDSLYHLLKPAHTHALNMVYCKSLISLRLLLELLQISP